MAVVLGAVVAVVLAVAGMAVPWRRMSWRRRPPISRYQPLAATSRDYLLAEGWPVELVDLMAAGPYDVTTQTYRNGTTRVWLKRKNAA